MNWFLALGATKLIFYSDPTEKKCELLGVNFMYMWHWYENFQFVDIKRRSIVKHWHPSQKIRYEMFWNISNKIS